MCQECLDAAKRHYPECDQIGDLLMGATCFPMGTAADVDRQLAEHRHAGCTTWQEAIARANQLLEQQMQ